MIILMVQRYRVVRPFGSSVRYQGDGGNQHVRRESGHAGRDPGRAEIHRGRDTDGHLHCCLQSIRRNFCRRYHIIAASDKGLRQRSATLVLRPISFSVPPPPIGSVGWASPATWASISSAGGQCPPYNYSYHGSAREWQGIVRIVGVAQVPAMTTSPLAASCAISASL
jgi:hypothetical protein